MGKHGLHWSFANNKLALGCHILSLLRKLHLILAMKDATDMLLGGCSNKPQDQLNESTSKVVAFSSNKCHLDVLLSLRTSCLLRVMHCGDLTGFVVINCCLHKITLD